MERRLTPSTYELILGLMVIVGLFFTLRQTVLLYFYPNMAVNATDWDFSNAITNNVWAVVFFILLAVIKILVSSEEKLLGYFTSVVMGISSADLVDKFIRGIRHKTSEDNMLLALSIVMPLIFLIYEYNKPKLKKYLKRYGTNQNR